MPGDTTKVADPKQTVIDASVKDMINNKNDKYSLSNMFTTFVNGLQSGKTPIDAHSDAVKTEAIRTNPYSVKYKIGAIITNNKGETAEVIGLNDNGSPIVKRKVSGK
jgi:hypothetical protein